ncbi:Mu transposase C-terminal domain-containing protein [Sphingomonas floccifaciens]|uniref:Mu transposase C-terminal domain-containing protein n=1 Tax=Sphingomonas floccifaciens TaxID=1844115 RepID=A0ABW4NC78_9SPHN
MIQEAIEAPAGTAERKAEVRRAAKKWREPERTIYNWIKRLEDAGGDMNALARKLPSDAGQRRAWVSRQFDAAWVECGFDPAELPAIGSEVDHLLCRAWASPAQRAGWEQVRRVALTLFRRDLGERGIQLPDAAIRISQRRVMQFQADRRLDVRENDRKRWDDTKPRIRRDATGLSPMEIVVMDVKPLDCIVRRADGTTSWPKLIAFMDWGTHRVFRHYALLAQGEGVRQEHVIDAFKAMVSHRDWGFPRQLYRDNGTEFAVFDKIRSALELINTPGARTIVNAKPYSGASKPIESKFATLDRFVFSQMRGWAGGDRMNKKTQTVGKPPAPYPGSFSDFVAEAEARIVQFESYPIKTGFFAGRSPADWYSAKLANGWRPVRVDTFALEAAFAKRTDRRVVKGAISLNGAAWRHPELARFNGQSVEIAMPYQRDAAPLINLPDLGWAALLEDMPFLPGQILGAIGSSREQRDVERAAGRRRRELRPIAPTETLSPNVVPLPGRASAAPLIDLGMSIEAKQFAGARLESIDRASNEMDEAARRRARRDQITRNLLREQANG